MTFSIQQLLEPERCQECICKTGAPHFFISNPLSYGTKTILTLDRGDPDDTLWQAWLQCIAFRAVTEAEAISLLKKNHASIGC